MNDHLMLNKLAEAGMEGNSFLGNDVIYYAGTKAREEINFGPKDKNGTIYALFKNKRIGGKHRSVHSGLLTGDETNKDILSSTNLFLLKEYMEIPGTIQREYLDYKNKDYCILFKDPKSLMWKSVDFSDIFIK